jgi:hypothetical protein
MEMQEQRTHPEPVSVTDWLITILLTSLPVINLIMLFVWAFGDSTHPSKSNWARASLIWMVIGIVIGVITVIALGGLAAIMNME